MKVVIAEVVGTTERTSKQGKTYKLTTIKDTEGNLYTDLYIGRSVNVGDELEMTRNDRGGWDVAKEQRQFTGGFKGRSDSPEQRASIEWQSSYKTAAEVTRDYFTFMPEQVAKMTLESYAKEVDKLATRFKAVIEAKPTPQPPQPTPDNDDLPPVDNYDEEQELSDKMAGNFFEELPRRKK